MTSSKKYSSAKSAFGAVWQYLQPYKNKVYIGASLSLLVSAMAAFIPFIYGNITDSVLAGSFNLAIFLLILWLAISLIRTTINHYMEMLIDDISIQTSNYSTLDMFSYVLSLPMSFHKDKKVGSTSRRITQGADHAIHMIIEEVMFTIGPNLVLFFISISILLFIEWRLTAILLVSSVIYAAITFYFTRIISIKQKKMLRAWERAFGFFFDVLGNIHNVKISGNENFETNRLTKEFSKAGHKYFNFRSLWVKVGSIQKIILDVSFVSVFAFGSWLLARGSLTPGQLLMFIGYTSLLTSPLSSLTRQYRVIQEGIIDINRMLEIKNKSPEQIKGGLKPDLKGDIKFNQVSFSYPKSRQSTLTDISFNVSAGQTLALVGKSGVGKTTIIDLIGRYYSPTKGQITIDGIPLSKINLKYLRDQIAVVPQEISLFNDNVINNIRYAYPAAKTEDVINAARFANAHEFISAFPRQYKQIVGERGIKLSTGQKQRLAIARAIIRNPKILILDEATSALDSESERLVQDALSRLVQGRTTIVIAHRLSTIKSADQIVVLEKGQIAEFGTHEELMQNSAGIYRNLWELQSARTQIKAPLN